jgi:hypothetical protein
MTRIQLRIYVSPGQAEVICNLKFKDNTFERLSAIVDTGAAVSLFPNTLLKGADYRLSDHGDIVIDQAGIANQAFEAVEAHVTIVLEDETGNQTPSFEIPVWFANTDQALIGFAGVLGRSVLYVDMLQQIGWIEINL